MLWLALSSLFAMKAPTVQWDLTVELRTEGEVAVDQVCLVTPVRPDRLDSPWFTGVTLDELVTRGVLTRDDPKGPIVFDRESALRSSWFDAPLPPEREPVRQAFASMRQATADDGSCRSREPAGCEPAWEFDPPRVEPLWPWAVMCSTSTPGADPTVAFLAVRAVDLDLGFTPFVLAFDAFGDSVQVRFDSVRTSRELQAAKFQASVGVVGGDVHRVPAVPSFGGRVRVPMRPRCRVQNVRLREDPERRASSQHTVMLAESTAAGEQVCDPEAFASARTCTLDDEDLRRGVFQLRVPMATTRRRHQLDVRVEADEAEADGATCASRSWTDGKEPDIIDLEPTQVRLRWRWPCFAKTSAELRCPAARVEGGRACEVDDELDADGCTYRCDTTRLDRQSVGWPVTVSLDQEDLGMRWHYEVQALDTEIVGELEPEQRRFLALRGARHPKLASNAELVERWPAWWTERRGDSIDAASVRHQGQWVRIAPVGTSSPVVGSVALPGAECRERVEVRYQSARSTSRKYELRATDATWPYLELPAPDRTAVPLLAAASVGAGVGAVPGGASHPQLLLAGDFAYRGFARRDRHRERPEWILGLRYFALYGRKDFVDDVNLETPPASTNTWRHGPALRFEVRYDRPEVTRSILGFGGAVGAGWTTRVDRDAVDGFTRPTPFLYAAPELTVHYRFLRASAFVAVLGPDPPFDRVVLGQADERPADRWMLLPGVLIGAEI